MLSTDPIKDSAAIAVNKEIIITFKEYVETGPNFRNISLKAGQVPVNGITSKISADKLKIVPPVDLAYGTCYTVTIPKSAVKDASCNYFENTYTFSFTTVKLGDLNGDDQVDILDPLWISSRLGPVVDPASRKADVNGDNVVNILDLLEVAQYLNPSTGS